MAMGASRGDRCLTAVAPIETPAPVKSGSRSAVSRSWCWSPNPVAGGRWPPTAASTRIADVRARRGVSRPTVACGSVLAARRIPASDRLRPADRESQGRERWSVSSCLDDSAGPLRWQPWPNARAPSAVRTARATCSLAALVPDPEQNQPRPSSVPRASAPMRAGAASGCGRQGRPKGGSLAPV